MPTHYEVLGLPATASADEVRHAYRRLAKKFHPDRAGDSAQFQLVTQAYAVLSDPARRAAYDRSLRPAPVAAPRRRRRHSGWYVLFLVAALIVGGVGWRVLATTRQSVGDSCLVGTWRGDAFEVPFRGSLDGVEIAAPIRGGAGVILTVSADGTVRTDYTRAAPLVGTDGAYRIEGLYTGRTIERWRAAGERVSQSSTDASGLRFRAMVNGREPDQPLEVTVLDGEYPYTCTARTLEVGPYHYTRP